MIEFESHTNISAAFSTDAPSFTDLKETGFLAKLSLHLLVSRWRKICWCMETVGQLNQPIHEI